MVEPNIPSTHEEVDALVNSVPPTSWKIGLLNPKLWFAIAICLFLVVVIMAMLVAIREHQDIQRILDACR
jgi:glycerol-3-phosphate acyltransferase PlsY